MTFANPELAMIGRSSVIPGFPATGEAEPVFDRFVAVLLLHIMQAEPINGQSTTT